MSKMSNEHLRAAESRSLDNAAEVERLRAENEHLKAIVLRLEIEKSELIEALNHTAGLAYEAVELREASEDPEDHEMIEYYKEHVGAAGKTLDKYDP